MTKSDPKKYGAVLLLTLTILMYPGLATAQSRISPDKIEDAFNAFYQKGSKKALLSLLSDKFMIGMYGRESEGFLLNLLDRYFPCDSVSTGKQVSGGVEAVFYPKGKAGVHTKIGTADDGSILYVKYLDTLYDIDREAASEFLFKVSFENKGGYIILTARINNNPKPLKLLFDTGADGMALPKSLADSLGLKSDLNQSASVVGGSVNIGVSRNNTIHLGGDSVPGQSIAIFENMNRDTDGIIGNTLLKKYIVKIDYDNNQLLFYRPGRFHFSDGGFTVPVDLDGNIRLKGKLNISGKEAVEGNFFFDTGAKYYLIGFRPFVAKNRLLVSGFKPQYVSSTVSMGQHSTTYNGLANSFSISSQNDFLQMPVTLMGGNGTATGTWNPGADGSLGVRLLSRYNLTIDLLARKIHFEPNKSISYPFDFVLGGYLLGFDNAGLLRIVHAVKPGIAAYSGEAIVKSIGGISAGKLLTDYDNIQTLMNTKKPVALVLSEGDETRQVMLSED